MEQLDRAISNHLFGLVEVQIEFPQVLMMMLILCFVYYLLFVVVLFQFEIAVLHL